MTTREPEWDEQERAWFLALAQYEAGLCPLCGRHVSICTAPGAEGRIHVPPPTRCHVTTAIERAREPYKGGKARYAGALMFTASIT